MRKKLFYVLISVFIIQLLIPISMIAYSVSTQNAIEKYGKEFLIKVDPYIIDNDGKIKFSVRNCSFATVEDKSKSSGYIYAVLEEDSQGIAYIYSATFEKPKTPYYIKSEEPSTYWSFNDLSYTPDETIQNDMRDYWEKNSYIGWLISNDTFTLRVKIYKGKYIIEGMQINGTEIEEYFKG